MRSTGRANQARIGNISRRFADSAPADALHSEVLTDHPIAKLPSASWPPDQATRYTEVDGWSAAWRCERERIRILRVRLSSGAPAELSTAGAYIPDLAEMRERFPEHTRLWDAIRHEFWANAVPEGHTG
ncbi:hypothetical protein [Nocardia carnea]|uniref:hypothetical protein n=1 Tax=Nocardia carnea TaxID=37328 RepID=UPI00245884D8|nr:hypothetical protein [Nocardia carnea]